MLLPPKPSTKNRVIDLVAQAGVDVSEWANGKGGAAKASTNPKYCYDWAFVEAGKVVVLSLWFEDILIEENSAVQRHNFRDVAEFYRKSNGKTAWVKRSRLIDEAIAYAVENDLPVRAIINTGDKRAAKDLNAKPSSVRFRELDPLPWTVTAYNPTTGDVTLKRNVLKGQFVDQFDARDDPEVPARSKERSVEPFNRDRRVRIAALNRASGRCEYCGENGFVTRSGEIYLETHHIVPLAENGPDHILNVVALCPNHHREAHYGQNKSEMRARLLSMVGG